jgi:hypothetical protein
VLLVLHHTCIPLLLYYLPKAPLTETRKLIFFVAFILYRQHYQAQVVAQHPGLANPEISKIIGEQWREQAPEVKSDWKRLAEVQNTALNVKMTCADRCLMNRKRSNVINDNIQVIDTSLDELVNQTVYDPFPLRLQTIPSAVRSATDDISRRQAHP